MRIQLARLAVLYDDLMLEYTGATEDGIKALGKTSMNARRFYFVRRTLGTLSEIRGAFAKLKNANKSFRKGQEWWEDKPQTHWDHAVKFFEQNHEVLKNSRNDVGGHFHDNAAEFAIDNVESQTVGLIELDRRGGGADIRLEFAYELLAVALVKNRDA